MRALPPAATGARGRSRAGDFVRNVGADDEQHAISLVDGRADDPALRPLSTTTTRTTVGCSAPVVPSSSPWSWSSRSWRSSFVVVAARGEGEASDGQDDGCEHCREEAPSRPHGRERSPRPDRRRGYRSASACACGAHGPRTPATRRGRGGTTSSFRSGLPHSPRRTRDGRAGAGPPCRGGAWSASGSASSQRPALASDQARASSP